MEPYFNHSVKEFTSINLDSIKIVALYRFPMGSSSGIGASTLLFMGTIVDPNIINWNIIHSNTINENTKSFTIFLLFVIALYIVDTGVNFSLIFLVPSHEGKIVETISYAIVWCYDVREIHRLLGCNISHWKVDELEVNSNVNKFYTCS